MGRFLLRLGWEGKAMVFLNMVPADGWRDGWIDGDGWMPIHCNVKAGAGTEIALLGPKC